MSKIEVDAIEPQSGTSLTLGASGDTLTIPSGATLVNNGTASGFGDNLEWQSSIVTAATITVTANKGYWIDTTSNACTITLPAAAAVGDQIIFTDYLRTWGTNAVTINRNGLNYQGGTENPVYDTNGQTVNIVYSGATQGWIPTSDDDVVNEGVLPPYSVDFLVIAGGGSGGSAGNGGGGGAGGYRTSTQDLNVGNAYTITVGDGGASVTANRGNSGSNSSISGSGITTITSAGGGGGGDNGENGIAGGSGGGAAYATGLIGGAGNTPSTSPSQGYAGGDGAGSSAADAYGGGGGGGAGAVGQNGTSSKGGDGGAGTASSITGSSVTRAGGGGGSSNTTIGSGGVGGGGDSGTHLPSTNGGAGTINTGSGGGASQGSSNSGAGGKGVVILSMPDASYSGTTTGSPTVATGVSGKTILTFTATGSYTA
jgi:hypothetical protein